MMLSSALPCLTDPLSLSSAAHMMVSCMLFNAGYEFCFLYFWDGGGEGGQ